jgi:hypothetical protein
VLLSGALDPAHAGIFLGACVAAEKVCGSAVCQEDNEIMTAKKVDT